MCVIDVALKNSFAYVKYFITANKYYLINE